MIEVDRGLTVIHQCLLNARLSPIYLENGLVSPVGQDACSLYIAFDENHVHCYLRLNMSLQTSWQAVAITILLTCLMGISCKRSDEALAGTVSRENNNHQAYRLLNFVYDGHVGMIA